MNYFAIIVSPKFDKRVKSSLWDLRLNLILLCDVDHNMMHKRKRHKCTLLHCQTGLPKKCLIAILMFTRLFHISKWQCYRRLGRIRKWMHCFYSTKFGSSRKQRLWVMPTANWGKHEYIITMRQACHEKKLHSEIIMKHQEDWWFSHDCNP